MPIASSALLSKTTGLLLPKLEPAARNLASRHRDRVAALKLLKIDYSETFDFVIPRTHPLLELDSPHPDDLAAFRALADPALAYCAERNLLEIVDTLETELERNLIIIGSPEAEPLAQLAYGYKRIKNSPGLEYAANTLDLPYRWHEDPRDIHGSCERYIIDHGWVTRPNWPIVGRNKAGNERRLAPEVDNSGRLKSDWLIITITPNFLTRRALDEGKCIINIAGSHGIGTRSIALLLRSVRELRKISGFDASHTRAFQVIVRASSIKHSITASIAHEVEVFDVAEIEDSDAVWNGARMAVARHFADWAAEQHPRNAPYPHERR